MNQEIADSYLVRFQQVVEFIDSNLGNDLSLEQLSQVAHFSKFHFQRQFSALFGLGVYEYIQLKRLKRASYQLAFRTETKVLEVAIANGYEGPEAFARAFKKVNGQTPSQFRRHPDWSTWHVIYQPLNLPGSSPMHSVPDIKIVEFPETKVAALTHFGDPETVGDSVRQFIAWRKLHNLHPSRSATFNIFYGNPDEVEPAEYKMDICAATDQDIEVNEYGVKPKVIPAGRCAVLRRVGTDATLASDINSLYTDWLPGSGEEPRDFPLFLRRVTFFPDVAENEAISEVYLPIV